jgi:alkylhydroperoxidase family enzyme
MQPRIDVTRYKQSRLRQAMVTVQREVEASGLEPSLLELVKVRASQFNGCAYCIDMHTKDARAR